MQALFLDRATRQVSPLAFATTLLESFYSLLHQTAGTSVFPPNCHANVAVNSLSLERNGYRYLLSGSADSLIKLWDLHSQTGCQNSVERRPFDDYDNPISTFDNIATVPRKTAHSFGVSAVHWWPYDTGMFVSASFDHTVKVWDTNELTPVHTFDVNNRVYSVDVCGHEANSMSANALVAVALDQPFIRLLDLKSTSSAHTLLGHKGKTLVVKWHPQNPHLLASGGFDGEVKVWDIRRSSSCLCRLDMHKTNSTPLQLDFDNASKASVKAHLAPVNGLVWAETGTSLFTVGNDDKIRVWDMVGSMAPPVNKLVNFGPLTRNKYTQTIPVLLSPRHESELQHLMFPSDNGDIFVFRTVDGKLVSRLSRKGTKNSGRTSAMVNAGPFSGTYFCGTLDGEIISWLPRWKLPKVEDLVDVAPVKRTVALQEARERLQNDPFFRQESKA